VNVADIMPTVATLIGAAMPLRDGISFLNALQGGDPPRDWTYVRTRRGNPPTAPGNDEAVIEERWKLRVFSGQEQLYDLLYDPLEDTPIDPNASSVAGVVARLRGRLSEARQ
jgi:arylsulfatase A-like enzyme